MLSMFGLEKLCLLNKTWIYPCNPSLHLHGQIGAACGKNSCLFSEIDKSIQITECKSHLKTAGKIHPAPLSLTLATSPSNEFQLPVPLPHAASFSSCLHCRNCPFSQHLQNVSLKSHCLSHGEQGGKRYVKEPSVEVIIDLTAWNRSWNLFGPCSQILAEHSCAKEEGLFTTKVNVPRICLIGHTRPRAPLSAVPGAGYGVTPSSAGRSQSKWAFSLTY